MRICTIDLETFWSQEHTLSKMNAMVYCMHPETEIISMSYKFDGQPTACVFGEVAAQYVVHEHDWSDTMVVGHNMSAFDSMILAWRLGLRPRMWGCTLAMARPVHALSVGGSLSKLVAHYGLGVKDTSALTATRGRHLKDFTPDERRAMETYNKADVDQCYALFQRLAPHFTAKEMWQIDATIRMLVEPQFVVDHELLANTLVKERARKSDAVMLLAELLGTDASEDEKTVEQEVVSQLASAAKFSALLERRGVAVPVKPSPTDPNRMIPAIAKTDAAFIELQEHEDPVVSAAARARLAVKSTILETRIEAFQAASRASPGLKLPIPLNYCGAAVTGRWSGWSFNPQNLPRVLTSQPKLSDALRNCILAPSGSKVVVADLSGIELRVNMFLWKVPYAMKMFRESPGEADLYRSLAAEVFGIPADQVKKTQRQAGKAMHLGCFSADTLVVTSNGTKRIIDVGAMDLVWDGEAWVQHSGVIHRGIKETTTFRGLTATSDHEILTGRGWVAWGEVCTNPPLYRSALSLATLPSLAGNCAVIPSAVSGSTPLSGVSAGGKDSWISTTCLKARARDATHALSRLLETGSNGIGSTQTSFRTTRIVRDCLTAFRRQLAAATTTLKALRTTAIEGLLWPTRGAGTGQHSFGTLSPSTGGTVPSWKWTESTMTAATRRETSGSLTGSATQRTAELSSSLSSVSQTSNVSLPVFDLYRCGPNHRFTVVCDDGPVIVHNCGFGLRSAEKFVAVAKQIAQINVTEDEAARYIDEYRERHPQIVQGWQTCHEAITDIYQGNERAIDPWGLTVTCDNGIRLPSGRLIRYPGLHVECDNKNRSEWWYGTGQHKTRIYAGKVTENVVQALARDAMADYTLQFYRTTGYRPALLVHDEWVGVLTDSQAQDGLDTLQRIMRTPLPWWPELVTWSEGDVAPSYGAAK